MNIYITRGDQRAGPYNLAQINAFLNIGRLTLEDYAWFEGCMGWIRVKAIPGVRVISSTAKVPSLSSADKPAYAVVNQKKLVTQAAPYNAYRTNIRCKICESGELCRTSIYRFSPSLNIIGIILLAMSILALVAIAFAFIPWDLSDAGASIILLKKAIISNAQFIFLSSIGGIILFFLFQTQKRVLQCNHCESIIAIE